MGSSNKHWPSMFKSKPTCNSHQWHSHKSPYPSGCEERSPEPKPRWNPKPEQIRILESIFNSGMVNPPRDEIRKIRAQLQEYGQVGDANVFYWFQNRKSRSKHKNRHLQKPNNHPSPPSSTAGKPPTTTTTSSSSEKSSSIDFLLNSPTASVNQQQPFFFPVAQPPQPPPATTAAGGGLSHGFCFPEMGSFSGMFLTDLMMMNHENGSLIKNNNNDGGKGVDNTTSVPSTITDIQGVVDAGVGKLTVFINDVAFEVPAGPFNVKEAFGDDAILIYSSGNPVMTNECGVTLQALQHGAFYYLVRSHAYDHVNTIDLI